MADKKRGLAAANKSTRKRVAKAGGEASHGGGRPSRQHSLGTK